MIYIVQAGDGRGPLKIGYTEGPRMMAQRLRLLQTGSAEKLYLVTSLPGGVDRERELHKRFAEGRLQGEWFRWDTPGLQEFVYDAIEAETVRLIEGLRYCGWCKTELVHPPRTKLCSDECEREKKRATSRAWKAAQR